MPVLSPLRAPHRGASRLLSSRVVTFLSTSSCWRRLVSKVESCNSGQGGVDAAASRVGGPSTPRPFFCFTSPSLLRPHLIPSRVPKLLSRVCRCRSIGRLAIPCRTLAAAAALIPSTPPPDPTQGSPGGPFVRRASACLLPPTRILPSRTACSPWKKADGGWSRCLCMQMYAVAQMLKMRPRPNTTIRPVPLVGIRGAGHGKRCRGGHMCPKSWLVVFPP